MIDRFDKIIVEVKKTWRLPSARGSESCAGTPRRTVVQGAKKRPKFVLASKFE